MNKPFKGMPFADMVDEVAHRAAMALIHGTAWRSIIHTVCAEACAWRIDNAPASGPGPVSPVSVKK